LRDLLGLAREKDRVDFKFVDAQQIDEFGTWQLTIRVPYASDIDKDMTKLGVQFPFTPEATELYLISDGVLVT
jgi:hypothetical protein